MKELIVRVEKVLEKAEKFVGWARRSTCPELMDVGTEGDVAFVGKLDVSRTLRLTKEKWIEACEYSCLMREGFQGDIGTYLKLVQDSMQSDTWCIGTTVQAQPFSCRKNERKPTGQHEAETPSPDKH